MRLKRFSAYQRKLIYDELVKRDTERCACPGTLDSCSHDDHTCDQMKGCVYGSFQIDHADGNPNHNKMGNFRLLCKRCNARWREYHKAKRLFADQIPDQIPDQTKGARALESLPENATERNLREVNYLDGSSMMQVKAKAWRGFYTWIMEEIRVKKRRNYKEVVGEGSWEFGVSDTTIKRYLISICSKIGPLEIIKDDNNREVIVGREKQAEKLRKLLHPFYNEDDEAEQLRTKYFEDKAKGKSDAVVE